MGIGKKTRLHRLFSHPSGRLCSVAVDHFIGYGQGLPVGLRQICRTLEAIVAGKPDAITMHKGIAASAWEPYAGKAPLILQGIIGRPDDSAFELIAEPSDAICLGADAFAVAVFVRGTTEAAYLRILAECVRKATRFDLPVIGHIYPRDFSDTPKIVHEPEQVAWAVRCGLECGVDVIKTPYCGDVKAFSEIVSDCPVPVVAAGGPKAEKIETALQMAHEVVQSGAKGATIGRNIWGFPQITKAVRVFKAVIHEGLTPEEAMCKEEL